jgi:hypothetical protein
VPPGLRELISAYQTCVADIVRRLGGFVAKYVGDGVLIRHVSPRICAAVGWPGARHDPDAQSAGANSGRRAGGRIAGNKDLPDEILAEIVGRTDGVPLFVEELTKSATKESSSTPHRAPPAVSRPSSPTHLLHQSP